MTTTPPRPTTHLRVLLLVAAVALQLLVLYAPRVPDLVGAAVPGLDKLGHAAVFAAVTVTGLGAALPPRLVVGLGLVHAVLSEVVQHALLPGRSGDPLDVVADVAGVLVGLVVARRVFREPPRDLAVRRAAR